MRTLDPTVVVVRPVASETSLEKTKDCLDVPTDCDRGDGGRLDASPGALLFLFSDWWLHPSDGLGMVCGVSEQEIGY